MKMHFYDLLHVGKSPAEGQVLRFHSALFGGDNELTERNLAVRLRDDVAVPTKNIDTSPLALLNLNQGISEAEFARAASSLFDLHGTLHVGLSNTSKLDPYVRHSIYRSLMPTRCIGIDPGVHYLDLETLYRAIAILRPQDLPPGCSADPSKLDTYFHTVMWELDWEKDNRAIGVKNILLAAQASSPKLVEHAFSTSNVRSIKLALGMDDGEVSDLAAVKPCLVIHPSILSPKGFSLLLPLATDINYPDIAYMADLESDLSPIFGDEGASLESLVRKSKDDGRPLVRVSLSRLPFVAPLGVIRPEDSKRLRVDTSVVSANVRMLRGNLTLAARLRDEPILELTPLSADVDHRMFAGEFPPADLQFMREIHERDYEEWFPLLSKAQDLRVRELAIRLIAREAFTSLPPDLQSNWVQHVNARMKSASPSSLAVQLQALENIATDYPSAPGIAYLKKRLEGVAVQT